MLDVKKNKHLASPASPRDCGCHLAKGGWSEMEMEREEDQGSPHLIRHKETRISWLAQPNKITKML